MAKKQDFIVLKYVGLPSIKLGFTKTASLEPFCDDFDKAVDNKVYVNLVKDRTFKVLNDELTQKRMAEAGSALVDQTKAFESLSISIDENLAKQKKELEAEKEALEVAKKAFQAEKEAFLKEKEASSKK
jgi:hypothetical protein